MIVKYKIESFYKGKIVDTFFCYGVADFNKKAKQLLDNGYSYRHENMGSAPENEIINLEITPIMQKVTAKMLAALSGLSISQAAYYMNDIKHHFSIRVVMLDHVVRYFNLEHEKIERDYQNLMKKNGK